jgi:hypothetical protein
MIMAQTKAQRFVKAVQEDYIRAVRRLRKQTKELELAQGALDRATVRRDAAQERVTRYTAVRDESLALLDGMPGAEVPEVEEEDVTDSENDLDEDTDDTETEETDEFNEDQAVSV